MREPENAATERGEQAAVATAPRGSTAVSWDAFLSTYLPALVLALGTGIALPAIPTLAVSFGVSFGVASGVVTAFLLGNLAGAIPSGWFVDRFGRRSVLIAGPLLTAVSALLVALSHSFAELLVLRFLGGFATQMWMTGRLAAISHGAAPGERGRQVSWMFGMDQTGRLAGPLVGGFIAASMGARAPFAVYAVLALLALVPTLLFAGDTPRRRPGAERSASGPALSMREIVVPRLAFFGVALFAGLTRGPLIADLLHLYAAFAYRLGPTQIGYLATAAAVIMLPISLVAGWMMDRFGRKHTMVPGFTGVAVSTAALAAVAFLHLSLAWYVTLFLLGVALQALTGGSIQTIGADVAPPQERGTFLGLWRFVGQGGVALSPIVFAILSDQVSYGSAFVFIAASSAVVAFLLIRFVPETRTAT